VRCLVSLLQATGEHISVLSINWLEEQKLNRIVILHTNIGNIKVFCSEVCEMDKCVKVHARY
jgi:hypothetical protein